MADGDRRPFPYLPLPAAEPAERAKLHGRATAPKRWPHDRQVERVRPQLQRLQDALERRRLELRGELAGVEPELALVIEAADSIQELYRAVDRVPGLEWLAEKTEPDLPSGEDFFKQGKEEQPVGGMVYLVMTDQKAVQQLLTLWQRYEKDEQAEFPWGLTKFRDLFQHIRTIRPWGPEDRLRETGLLEDWRERLQWDTGPVRAQVELWFREREEDRAGQIRELEVRLRQSGGRLVGQSVVIPQIAYHGCIVEVPAETASDLVAERDVELVRCEGIMFMRPVGQLAVPIADEEPAEAVPMEGEPPSTDQEPVVAVLDGLPLAGHDLLRDRLRIDDPEDWGRETPVVDRHHGTAMVSLVVHGDLGQDGARQALSRPVYVRPLLKPQGIEGLGRWEAMPEDVLEVDLVHRAVRRILVGEGDEPPAAPEVLAINFSIGDPSRPFDRQPSPLARLLDWLSWEYGVLFIVSAGNAPCASRLNLLCSRQEFREMGPEQRQLHAWQGILEQAHLRRILAPAESINALTIGAEHSDLAGTYDPNDRIDLFEPEDGWRFPSPVTTFGGGVGRSLKPDVYLPGGRQLYRERFGTSEEGLELERVFAPMSPPGQRVAAPGRQPGRTDSTRFLCGTSNAAALTTRNSAQLFERLSTLLEEVPERRFLVPLLKGLLVHDASWGASAERIRQLLAEVTDSNRRSGAGRFLGYGFPEQDRILGCHDQRATLCGWGELGDGEGHVYRIPLPPSLSAERAWRRLTITLAWLSPIQSKDQRYRRAHLWFDQKPRNEDPDTTELLQVQRCESDNRAAQRGTLQHEIFEGEQATAFTEEDDLVVRVSCRAHAGDLRVPVPYALVVSLEVAEGIDIPIYEEIRVRLRPRVRVRQ